MHSIIGEYNTTNDVFHVHKFGATNMDNTTAQTITLSIRVLGNPKFYVQK